MRSRPTRRRLSGPDVVRAVALIGVVVMNYHGYLIIRDASPGTGWAADVFDPFEGPLSTRFAVTFVLVAGVGVTLLTRRVVEDRDAGVDGSDERLLEMRWRLARRGLALYVLGELLDVIWPGSIIPYYGAMFAIAALLFTLRTRSVVMVGVASALAGWGVHTWSVQRRLDGESVQWLTAPGNSSVRRYVFDLAINGTHPLLPWLAFFCAGIIVGRFLEAPGSRLNAGAAGLVLLGASTVVDGLGGTPLRQIVLSGDPYDRGLVYVASALGSALLAFAVISELVDRVDLVYPALLDPLRLAGRMTLTLYITHILVFNLVVDWLEWVEPAGLGTALVFALGFWLSAIVAGTAWSRRYGLGPAERVYRRLGA